MVGMETSRSGGKRLWGVLRAVVYVLRKRLSVDKLVMDLLHLLKRGRTARRALGNFLAFNPHHLPYQHRSAAGPAAPFAAAAGLSCRSMDPTTAFYNPRPKEVQFSCSSTPSHPSIRRSRRHHHHHRHRYDFDAEAVAEALELVLSNPSEITEAEDPVAPAPESPDPVERQLQISDSSFLLSTTEEEAEDVDDDEEEEGHVDEDAEEFIRRFYEQLRLQQRFAVTPEYRRSVMVGRA